ncbi:16S rRNA (guanine(527)-N(7))-methyltransferase RsmG [Phosphitispora fastidiosa]|uniref:16S rRNA (guanine(527)-N(7))-methyltransferase RsmG n=1 Tax=Phosphitispora fastidiosa TaxID=2837202 RepID=UPI001E5EC80D|nr:16S rRNA (guanine(527)-N(7))-methyltransferase RsmG [Phosphitispora fastidiosa]MBU7007547.1 16S rRNA (guanine527-N7)-methyltransferase [Phosphitispora fastidiosa]
MQEMLEGILYDGSKALGISLTKVEVELYFRYLKILLEWNKKFNLTAIVKPEEVIKKHFLDSIAPLPLIIERKPSKVIDVGTGAGFPGIPLKIAFRENEFLQKTNVVLLDSLKKRVQFLEHLIIELRLDNINPVHGRAEDFGQQQGYRESYDIAVSRAVSGLAVLSEYCLPFVKVNGIFIAYKGPNVNEEIKEGEKAVNILGGRITEVKDVKLPGMEQSRFIVIIEKVASTPEKYPRKAGMPEKRPLS